MALLRGGRSTREPREDYTLEAGGCEQVAEVLTQVTGREIHYLKVPLEQVRQTMGEDGALMFKWFDEVGYSADIEALRREHLEVGWHTFEEWAKEQNWSTLG